MTQQEYENKIKELQDELEKLKAAKIADSGKRWKPIENEDTFYYVDFDGNIENCSFTGEEFDEGCYLTGNCFKTRQEAEEHKKQIEYTARYKNYIEEHSEPIDWGNLDQCKYYAGFNKGQICVDFYRWQGSQGTIYASSEQIIWDAIKEIGEDNFKKYVLGVK